MMESFCLLIKIITAAFYDYRSLEVVRMFWEKTCKIIVFGHMDTKANFYQEIVPFNIYLKIFYVYIFKK